MTPAEITKAAQNLFTAEKTQEQIGLLTIASPNMQMDDAYAVQKVLVALKIADGRRVTGWKIGLTSKAMQYALNIDIPDSGILFTTCISKMAAMSLKAGSFSRVLKLKLLS